MHKRCCRSLTYSTPCCLGHIGIEPRYRCLCSYLYPADGLVEIDPRKHIGISGSLDDTLIIVTSDRKTVVGVLRTAGYGQEVTLSHTCARCIILPVTRHVSSVFHILGINGIVGVCLFHIPPHIKVSPVLLGIHKVIFLVDMTDVHTGSKCNQRFVPGCRLGGDENHTIRSLRAIDRGRRCVLQYLH